MQGRQFTETALTYLALKKGCTVEEDEEFASQVMTRL